MCTSRLQVLMVILLSDAQERLAIPIYFRRAALGINASELTLMLYLRCIFLTRDPSMPQTLVSIIGQVSKTTKIHKTLYIVYFQTPITSSHYSKSPSGISPSTPPSFEQGPFPSLRRSFISIFLPSPSDGSESRGLNPEKPIGDLVGPLQ